jgi:hypothetical protein
MPPNSSHGGLMLDTKHTPTIRFRCHTTMEHAMPLQPWQEHHNYPPGCVEGETLSTVSQLH